MDKLISIKEVAKLLSIHPNTIRKLDGVLRPVRMNNRGDRRYRLSDINQVIIDGLPKTK